MALVDCPHPLLCGHQRHQDDSRSMAECREKGRRAGLRGSDYAGHGTNITPAATQAGKQQARLDGALESVFGTSDIEVVDMTVATSGSRDITATLADQRGRPVAIMRVGSALEAPPSFTNMEGRGMGALLAARLVDGDGPPHLAQAVTERLQRRQSAPTSPESEPWSPYASLAERVEARGGARAFMDTSSANELFTSFDAPYKIDSVVRDSSTPERVETDLLMDGKLVARQVVTNTDENIEVGYYDPDFKPSLLDRLRGRREPDLSREQVARRLGVRVNKVN